MIDYFDGANLVNFLGAWPNGSAKNASGAGVGDGTEIIKLLLDNGIFGWQQALLDAAGLTTDGLTEAIDTSQILQAIRCICGHPGECVEWWGTDDPATVNARILILTGQVVLIANYPEMCAAVYCGDADNATASAFYKTSDAAGTIRNTGGTYMVLPDCRGYFLRGLDVAASIDPDGASRDIGHVQWHAIQGHYHEQYYSATATSGGSGGGIVGSNNSLALSDAAGRANRNPITGTHGAVTVTTETRPSNIAIKIGIRY